jgi:poly-gamma-glutamate synthesis protein (capsule biosynthesis protein)
MLAGESSRHFPARPGINGIRWRESLLVSGEDISVIEDISDKTGVNEEMKMDIAQGYRARLPEGVFDMGAVRFEESDVYGNAHRANEDDVERVLASIREAKSRADYVLLSFHTHEMSGATIENIPDFVRELSHRFIDEGAHAVIGHGPHLLRAIEVYRERPIFYSLGDFMLELYSVEEAPEDFYRRYGLTSEVGIHELLKKRSANFTRGLMEERIMTEAVIPYWEMENGRLTRLELLPIECGKHGERMTEGVPMVAEDLDFIAHLAEISAPLGVRMHIEDGIVKCEWK